jgi:hypothetical protein
MAGKKTKDRNIVAEFDAYFGHAQSLESWQRLCRDVGINEDLSSIKKCRKVPPHFPNPMARLT